MGRCFGWVYVLILATGLVWAQTENREGSFDFRTQGQDSHPVAETATRVGQPTWPENVFQQELDSDDDQASQQPQNPALRKVREWESGWIAGGYIGKNRKLVAMTAQQRKDLYLRQTFTTVSPYLKRLFAAGIDQARGVPREWGGGWGGYAKRFASREGQFFASNSITAWGNAKLGYEPRYDQCKCSGFGLRLRHAMMRNFVTYNSTEREHRPQLALYLGSFGGGVISTAWKPHPRNAFAEGGRAVLGQAGFGVALNVFTEFAKDIDRKIWGRKR